MSIYVLINEYWIGNPAQPVHYMSVTHSLLSVASVSLWLLLSSTVCSPSVSTSHFTVCCFCVTMSTAVFCRLSTVCQYVALYRLMVLCHYAHCYLLHSVHCLSVSHTLLPVGSVSLCPLLYFTICPLSLSNSHCTVRWFWVTVSNAIFYSPCTVCP